jgi:hypothetical protein
MDNQLVFADAKIIILIDWQNNQIGRDYEVVQFYYLISHQIKEPLIW